MADPDEVEQLRAALRAELLSALEQRLAALQPSGPPAGAEEALAAWAQAHPEQVGWVRPAGAEGTRATAPTVAALLAADPAAVANLLGALAAPARLVVLRELLPDDQTTGQLVAATGLGAGPLHFHLRTLALAALIEQRRRGRYAITPRGRDALYAALLLSPDL